MHPDDEIDRREFFATLWRGKWIIILTTIVLATGGVLCVLSKPNIYQYSLLLAPPVAKEWAEKIVDINEHMREQDVKEAGARIPYLEGKLQGTNIAGMQQVFYQLLESEPKRALIAIVATILGVFTVFVIAFIRSGKTSAREENK